MRFQAAINGNIKNAYGSTGETETSLPTNIKRRKVTNSSYSGCNLCHHGHVLVILQHLIHRQGKLGKT